jgi:hypothetical protein
MATTYKAIATVTVGSGGAATIDFTSIPQTYTDLVIMSSVRGNQNNGIELYLRFNGSTSGYSGKYILKDSSDATPVSGNSYTDRLFCGIVGGATPTASTFSNDIIYIPNYTSSNNKSLSIDSVMESNSTVQWMTLASGLWSNSSAITSISLYPNTNVWIQHSSATLYGIKNS